MPLSVGQVEIVFGRVVDPLTLDFGDLQGVVAVRAGARQIPGPAVVGREVHATVGSQEYWGERRLVPNAISRESG